jgi:hypothetical protein
VGDALHVETVRHHLQATGERLQQELGDERQPNLFGDGLKSSRAKAFWRFGGKKRVRCRLPSASDLCRPTMRSRAVVCGSC